MSVRTSISLTSINLVAAGAVLVAASGGAFAFDDAAEIELGQAEYMDNCAACHGETGRGDGPVASVLTKKPLDLTQITARYSGQFPEEAIYEMIDGRNMINPHGDRGMPVWGDRYFSTAVEEAQSVPFDVDAQALAHGRITALIRYLESIQAE